jgi:hypothetical protein
VDNGLRLMAPLLAAENLPNFTNPVRGVMRGLAGPMANIPQGSLHLQVLGNVVGSSRRWLMVGHQQQGSYCHMAFDITGPW